jgi:hypothetical protein
MTPQQVLAQSVASCKMLTSRYLAGFNSLNHTRQAPGLPNHVAWCLGHCALTLHRVAACIDQQQFPETDFSAEQRPPASDDPAFCFFAGSIAFASQPVDDAAIYPSFERCVQIYENACDRLSAAIASAPPGTLDREVPWGEGKQPLGLLISRMIFHNGMHTGQIADLRRALGMPSIFA